VIPSTGFALLDWFLAAMNSWGYLIVFVFTIFENLFVLGTFTPGETVVIFGGLVASQGDLSVAGVWIVSVLGTIIGSNISFWAGRRAGLPSVRAFVERLAATRIGRLFRLDADGLVDVQQHFDDHGSKTVLISRFAIGAKNFVPAVAGAVRMPVFWYEFYTVVGAMLYTTLMIMIGWFLGENLDRAMQVARAVGAAGLGIFTIFVLVAYIASKRIRERRRLAAAEREEADAADSDPAA
jgi:membrane protein DedA with SNARE-associated domain